MSTKGVLNPITNPFDFLKYNLNDIVFIKLRKERTITGRLHAFDQHMNMIIGDADETYNKIVIDEDTQESSVNIIRSHSPMMFIRGDGIIFVSPKRR